MGISEDYKFMADFYLNFEASARIIEIPLGTKTCSVIDNPCGGIEINPFQLLDNSQRIGFTIEHKSFTPQQRFPAPVSDLDQYLKSLYARNLDLVDLENITGDQVNRKSISKQRFVEVYRLDRKPKSLMDFEGQDITTIDLSIADSKNKLSQTIFYDKIGTNKKYYYLFRFLNDHKIPGYMSDIYEIELIDDGSFKYSIIDAIVEQDLESNIDIFSQPTKSFKKLLMIRPSQRQMMIDASQVDYNNESFEEIDNVVIGDPDLEDSIWGNTFKFRLTSKKTGKMIDLNITYKNITYSE